MSELEPHPFGTIAVLGPGLIGGSLLKAVRKFAPTVELRAWARREDAADRLRGEGWADVASSDLVEVVAGVDLAILCMPVEAMAESVERFPKHGEAGRFLVTDVGSVKRSVVDSVEVIVEQKGGVFLGSHPMAGSEKSGMEHASADLFVRAPVILTPGSSRDSSGSDLADLTSFWRLIGGDVSVMSPQQHDEVVAAISHLPHLVAAALVNSSLGKNPEIAAYSGGGFRDTTRVAAGLADMWTGILWENREAVLHQLTAFSTELEKWKEALGSLDRDQLRSFLKRASTLRQDS